MLKHLNISTIDKKGCRVVGKTHFLSEIYCKIKKIIIHNVCIYINNNINILLTTLQLFYKKHSQQQFKSIF